jgi:hypothetical protein
MIEDGFNSVTLESLNNGQAVALFEREMKAVLKNIADENTPAEAKRIITISISIKPEEDRGGAAFEVTANSKLAQVKPSKAHVLFSFDGRNITAYQTDAPKQFKLGVTDGKGDISRIAAEAGEKQ